ncbi:hypothetical protein CHISP_1747 [Chitinispirillum alkaliphilum]|nr:hypothetical protein CHISP_1747 [Chitinispirillum alkaliphilum]
MWISTLFFIACDSSTIPVSDDLVESPYQQFNTATLFFYEGQAKRWRLESDYIHQPLADTGLLTVLPVNILIYDQEQNPTTLILADTGFATVDMDIFHLRGRVFIRTEDSLVVRTERLKWIREERKVESDDFVQIETARGDVLRGRGLDAVDNFSSFSFRSNVTGKFPDIRRRMEQDEDLFFR